MRKTIIKTKAEARQKAIDFQNWQSDKNLSYNELSDWFTYFSNLAKRFNLVIEFKENGII